MPAASQPPHDPAEALLARWLAQRESGAAPAFDALLAEHAQHATRLRALFEVWERLSALTRAAGSPSRGAESTARGRHLRESYGLPIQGSPEEPRPTEELLDRIADRQPLGARYAIECEIGRGGMGIVYRVQDGDLRRALAMKVLLDPSSSGGTSSDPGTQGLLARFLEEAQITGQLDHPGIVPVHDLGVDAEGRVCFTMRLVQGDDLKQVFEHLFAGHGGWNETRALSVILKVCEAMAFAHKKGVIHRDLKPSNVMVGKFGEVYVMDWGLARVVGKQDPHDIRIQTTASVLTSVKTQRREEREGDTDSPLVTMDGQVVGTPAYMSPEQAQGMSEDVGPRSDVYSVGAILWHLLARQVPYVPPGAKMTMRTVHLMVLQGPPTALTRIRPDVPAELVAICEKAMARDPARRYADMAELAEDLRAYLEQRVVKAYSTGPVAELRKWVQRNKPLAASIAAGVVIAVGGLAAISLVQADRRREAQGHALESQKQAAALEQRNSELAQRNAELARFTGEERLQRLINDSRELPFATAEHLLALEAWMATARELVLGDGQHTGLEAWRASLVKLSDDPAGAPSHDPLLLRRAEGLEQDVKRAEEQLRWLAQVFAHRFQDAQPPAAELEAEGLDWTVLPSDPEELNALAWRLVRPDRPRGGPIERRAVAIARRALAKSADAEKPIILDTLAWALHEAGRDTEAMEASRQALALAPADSPDLPQLEENRLGLAEKIAQATSPQQRLEDERRIADLERNVSALRDRLRAARALPDEATYVRYQALRNLVPRLEQFADPQRGLMSGTDAESGFSFERRIAFARSVEERTVTGPDAAQAWRTALEAIRDRARCPVYDGLVIEPQVGLLPLGPDPDSNLWEFAALATGAVPVRGVDGQLGLDESSALVLVLLPGGRFLLGAQSTDASEPNYDPGAGENEGPVNATDLAPYFVAKHELTQAQWRRLTGVNPSNVNGGRRFGGKLITLLHPVETIDWKEAREVLALAGLLLPTEAQWEFAARGGTSTPWWCGESPGPIEDCGNLADPAFVAVFGPSDSTAEGDDGWAVHSPVTASDPNPFGLHGVIGNVSEWCLDLQGDYTDVVTPPAAERQPFAALKRVIRGGGWASGPVAARSAGRDADEASYKAPTLGVRPARAVTGRITRAAGR